MRIQSVPGVVLLALLAGCASSRTMYSRNDVGKPWSVQEATVVQVTEATIEGREQGQIGTIGGGFIGHAVGHSIGHGAGSSIAGAVGAVAGAIVGQQAERKATEKRAWEILVELEGGAETLAIARSDGAARVAKL